MRNKLFHFLFVFSVVTILCLFIPLTAFGATRVKTTQYYTLINNEKVYVLNVSDCLYLFLPNEANINRVSIFSENQDEGICFAKNENTYDTVDLNELLPFSDGSYVVTVKTTRNIDAADEEEYLDLTIMQGTGIGSLYFNSDNKEEQGRKYIEKSKDNKGEGEAIYVDVRGKIINKDKKNQKVTDIHGRGRSSWYDPKKGYQIKFDKKIALIDGTKKEKKWVLLAQYKDPLRMNDKICKDIANATQSGFSPQETWVNFYYDGEYRGVYLLGEKNEIKEGRIDIEDMEEYYEEIDKTYGDSVDLISETNSYGNKYTYQNGLTGPKRKGGYIIEMNEAAIDENNGFFFKIGGKTRAVNLKSPDLGSNEVVKYISEYFQEFCDAITAKDNNSFTGFNSATGLYYYDYCDLDSLVDSLLIQIISRNQDAFFCSQYFYKDVGKKMTSGPLWDMDLTFGTGWNAQRDPSGWTLGNSSMVNELMQIPGFQRKVKDRYFEIYHDIMETLIADSETEGSFLYYYSTIKTDLAMDHIIWPTRYKCGDGSLKWTEEDTFDDIVNYRINWIENHKSYLDNYYSNMSISDSDTCIYDAIPETSSTHKRTCTIHGEGESYVENCKFETNSNEDGTHTSVCVLCGNTINEECTYNVVNNEDGTHTKTCNECGEVITEKHIWDSGKVVVPPTCTEKGERLYSCTDCDATYTEVIDPLGHNWNEPVWSWSKPKDSAYAVFSCANDPSHIQMIKADITSETTEPSCKENGKIVYTATISEENSLDNKEYTDEETVPIAKLPHTIVHHDAVAPTCDTDGSIEYWQCSECKAYYADKDGRLEITEEATVIKAAHKLEKTEEVPATCLTDGTAAYWTCTECHKLFSDSKGSNEITAPAVIEKTGHSWGDWVEVRGSTCVQKGQRVRVCRNDPTHLEYEDEDLLNHTMTHHEKVDSTCKDAGNIEYWTCDVCRKYFSDEAGTVEISKEDTVIAKKSHTWDEGKVTREPTCAVPGEKTFTCDFCKSTYTEPMDPIGHKWHGSGWTWSKDHSSASAVFSCENDPSHIQMIPADVVSDTTDPTCVKNGKTVYTATVSKDKSPDGKACTDEKTVPIAKLPHTIVHHNAVVPTCDTDGNTEYWQCSECKAYYADKDGKQEITEEETVIKAAHKLEKTEEVPATCLTDGTAAYWTCTECHKLFSDSKGSTEITAPAVIEKTGHSWGDWVEVRGSTCVEKGQRVRVCRNDPTHLEYEDEDLLNHTMTHHEKVDSTCKDAGNIEYWTCDVCRKYFSDEAGTVEISKEDTVIAKKSHTWDEGKVTSEPTCSAPGVKTFTCSNCNETYTLPLEPLGHNYGSWERIDDNKHQRVCENDSQHVEIGNHNWSKGEVIVPATTSSTGVMLHTCNKCNAIKKTVIKKVSAKKITVNVKTVNEKTIKNVIASVETAGGKADTIILGKKVKTINANAFAGTNVRTIIVKTKKLNKNTVKASLKGSKVKTVKVKVGKAKDNNKYLEKYRRVFTSKNVGKKVRVVK